MHQQLPEMYRVPGSNCNLHLPLPDQLSELRHAADSPVLSAEGDSALKRLLGDCC